MISKLSKGRGVQELARWGMVGLRGKTQWCGLVWCTTVQAAPAGWEKGRACRDLCTRPPSCALCSALCPLHLVVCALHPPWLCASATCCISCASWTVYNTAWAEVSKPDRAPSQGCIVLMHPHSVRLCFARLAIVQSCNCSVHSCNCAVHYAGSPIAQLKNYF